MAKRILKADKVARKAEKRARALLKADAQLRDVKDQLNIVLWDEKEDDVRIT